MLMTEMPVSRQVDWSALSARIGWIDIVFLIVLLVGVVYGMRKGLTKALPGLIGVVLAQTFAIEYDKAASAFVQGFIPLPPVFSDVAMFALIVVAVMFAVVFIFKFLSWIATIQFKSEIDRGLGACFSALRFVLLLGLLASFLSLIPVPFLQETFQGRSLSGSFLAHSSERVHDVTGRFLPSAWRVKSA